MESIRAGNQFHLFKSPFLQVAGPYHELKDTIAEMMVDDSPRCKLKQQQPLSHIFLDIALHETRRAEHVIWAWSMDRANFFQLSGELASLPCLCSIRLRAVGVLLMQISVGKRMISRTCGSQIIGNNPH